MGFKLRRSGRFPVAVVIIAGLLLLAVFAALAGAAGGPGGSDDPLVTKSYVQGYVDGQVRWQVAELKAGQALIGSAGAEFVVRRGNALIVDRTGNGVPDLTAGADAVNGQRAELNHLLVFPRDDGRGVRATDFAVVMYRGGANLQ